MSNDNDKCPCDAVVQMRKDMNNYIERNDARISKIEDRNSSLYDTINVMNQNIVEIKTQLKFVIAIAGVIGVSLAAVVVPMIFK